MQGFMHPLLTPSHILLILGLGLLFAQQKNQISSLLLYAVALITGLIIKQMSHIKLDFELILLGAGLTASLLVILKLDLPILLVWMLAVFSGIALGLDSSPVLIPGLGTTSINNWLVGAACSFVLIILLTTLIARFINRFWQGIILRVLASWIATSAIFVLTFMLIQQ